MSSLSPEEIFEILTFLEMNLGHLTGAFFFGQLTEILLEADSEGRRRWYVTAVYAATMIFLGEIPVVLDSFAAYILGVLAVFAVLLPGNREDIWIKVFLCVTFFSIRFHVMSAINQINMSLYELGTVLFNKVTENRYINAGQISMVHIALSAALGLLWLLGSFVIMAKFAARNVPFRNRRPDGKEILILLMPGILGALCYFMIHWIHVESGPGQNAAWFSPWQYFSIWLTVLMINILSLASIFAVWKLFHELERKQEEEKYQELLENQMREMQSHIREIEQLYAGIRGMKHDVKNHITVMESLMVQQNYEEARAWLGSVERAVEQMEYEHRTGNPVTDVIINEKYSRAKEEKVRFETGFFFPEQEGPDVFDISIILNNALENALEAVSREPEENRQIILHSRCRKQVFLIEIKNTFTGSLDWDRESGLPLSAKEDRQHHGLGLKNIRRAAEKYYGAIDIETKDGMFLLTVMLNLGGHSMEKRSES